MLRPSTLAFVITGGLVLYLFWSGSLESNPKRRNPGDNPEPAFRRVIVAVGDLHGDFGNMMKVLQMAKVVGENGSWTGAADYLVQTGDIVDRGDDTIKMYKYLEDLRTEARAAGGDVLSHFGNHEIMNLIGDWRYVPKSEIKTFGTIEDRQNEIATGFIGQSWRANYKITSRVPLHSALGSPNTDFNPQSTSYPQELSHAAISFVHGGLSPVYSKLTPYPSAINSIGEMLVHRLQDRKVQPPPHPPHRYPGLPEGTTREEHELYGSEGPLWYRGWAYDSERVVCKDINQVLNVTGVRRLVMGHTPNFEGMVSRCNGKIILIDTGISHAYGEVLSAARFVYTITPTDNAQRWIERETVHAIYENKEDALADDSRELVGKFGANPGLHETLVQQD